MIKEKKKRCILDLIFLLVPYVIIGSSLAFYNYARFDNILEFGQTYQLTAQDQLHSVHSLKEIPLLLWLSLFQPLHYSAVFPFVTPPDSINHYAGHVYIGQALTSLFGQAPGLILILSPTLWKKWKKEQSSFSFHTLLSCMLLMFLLLVMELLNAGIEWRYTSEMAPVFGIVMSFLLCNSITKLQIDGKKTVLSIYYLVSVFTLMTAFLRGIGGMHGYVLQYHPEFYYTLDRLFSFWK